jgi:1-pyrroline-5-carboxylate dehydrogenase
MLNAHVKVPLPINDPVKSYAPNSPERAELKAELKRVESDRLEIPVQVGSERFKGSTFTVKSPFLHQHTLATVHQTESKHVELAIQKAMHIKRDWSMLPFQQRAAIFLRAAELLATKYRSRINAVTMWGQGKTAHQAEIDAACEGIDFLRYNVAFAQQLLDTQPASSPGIWNMTDYRPLDGFVLAVAPFNFTAIALNLFAAPALMGNVVLFKPAETATLSSFTLMEIMREAGLPDGVVSFLPGNGLPTGQVAFDHQDFGGLHFTGSTATFNSMWKTIGEKLPKYRQYPRIVGETGGKDFIFIHESAKDDLDAVATAIVRGGFEFQGQKCSACSRVYVPKSLWPQLKERLIPMIEKILMGPTTDFSNFMSAVIDERSFEKCSKYIALGKEPGATILAGGTVDKREGWYVRPTLIEVSDAGHRLMKEEIFGPIVSLFVYPDDQFESTLSLCDTTAPYALTGAIFARDRFAVEKASQILRHAAGNFYINDKPTGAVVGQQPFGGGRSSGTNDKAGALWNLLRWTSPRTVKETLVPPTAPHYPFMDAP